MQAQNKRSDNIGIIEGFFGRSWSWEDRKIYAQFLKKNNYDFYIYAPKDDSHLRKNWHQDWLPDIKSQLHKLRQSYAQANIQFGIGLSPYEIYLDKSSANRQHLSQRIQQINQLNPDILCILFDDMRGDIPNLAQLQIDIAHQAADESTAKHIIFCPTYYSFDPVLEKVFGKIPVNYWQTFVKRLDTKIDVFWTGEKVCSASYSRDHLTEATQLLGRKPFLWDNYPVNDGAIKSNLLQLRAFDQSHSQLNGQLAGHAVNPMNQAWLSQIPLASLPLAYRQKNNYASDAALVSICANLFNDDVFDDELCDDKFTRQLLKDIPRFQDQGLNILSDDEKRKLVSNYSSFVNNPYAQEIIAWLNGHYQFDPLCLTE